MCTGLKDSVTKSCKFISRVKHHKQRFMFAIFPRGDQDNVKTGLIQREVTCARQTSHSRFLSVVQNRGRDRRSTPNGTIRRHNIQAAPAQIQAMPDALGSPRQLATSKRGSSVHGLEQDTTIPCCSGLIPTTVCVFCELGNLRHHVLPPENSETLWVWGRPLFFLYFFPVLLPPFPPLKSSTSQAHRADFFVVNSGHMPCPAELNVHVALLDPSVTPPVPQSPPLVLSIQGGFFTPITFATILALKLAMLVPLDFDSRPNARAPEHCSLYNVQAQNSRKP